MGLLTPPHRTDRGPGDRTIVSSEAVVEDNSLLSSHMRELIQESVRVDAPRSAPNIPRVLIQFWHDPGALPADVCECLESWQQLETQGFRRVLFDDNEARR